MIKPHFLLFLALVAAACTGKDPDVESLEAPTIEDIRVLPGEDYSKISIVCKVSSSRGIKEYGILFGENQLSRIPGTNMNNNGFSVNVEGLEYSKKYIYQAYIDGGRGTVYSKSGIWETVDEVPPVPVIIKTTRGYASGAGQVALDCFINNLDGTVGKDALQCGICYCPEGSTPTLSGTYLKAAGFKDTGDYTVNVEGLVTSAKYTFRPFTLIGSQVSYGEPLTLRIPAAGDVVLTEGYSDVGLHSVTLEGVVAQEIDEKVTYAFELNGNLYLADAPGPSGHFFITLDNLTPDTDYIFRAVVKIGLNSFYGETMSFRTLKFETGENDYIDMGLGVLWASCNLGASGSSGWGDRYAWGEITPKHSGSWQNYKWCLGTKQTIFKYTLSVDNAQPDNKRVLDPEDDAATAALGGKWRMPTEAEFNELLLNSTYIRTTIEEMDGFLFTSTVPGFEDKQLFLPNTSYWTAELCSGSSVAAKTFDYWRTVENYVVVWMLFVKDIGEANYWGREDDEDALARRLCRSIRPVLDRE